MPDRVLEFASYLGMIACVAAGTGFAIVPKSVLVALHAIDKIKQHDLPEHIAKNCTYLVWRGQSSLALNGLIKILKITESTHFN